jgi:iron(III) transport system permease protein
MFFGFLLRLTLLLLLGVTLLPVLAMIADAFWSGQKFDTAAFGFMLEQMEKKSFRDSLLLAALVAGTTTAAGALLGIVLTKVKLPLAKVWLFFLLLPLTLPPYMIALGWYEVVGRQGFWGELLFGFWGVFWVFFTIYLPIPLLLTSLFLHQIDARLEEAGVLVTDWIGVLRFITLPLIFPGLILSFLLVFILAFGEQSVPGFLRYDLFAQESFTYFSAFYDFHKATVLAVPMVLVALLFLAVERYLTARRRIRFLPSTNIMRIDPGKWRIPMLFVIGTLVLFMVVLPFWHLFAQAMQWDIWQTVLPKASGAAARSYLYAGAGAVLLSLLGIWGAYFSTEGYRGASFYDGALIFMFALPATVIGIALIRFWNHPQTIVIYMTPAIILLGYLGKYLVLSTKITQNRFMQIPRSQIEAASLAGANRFAQLRYIYLPLSEKVVLLGWIIGFIFCLRETTMTMLLYPPGYETLPIYILTQMANGKHAEIAVMSVLMILITALPLFLILRFAGRLR